MILCTLDAGFLSAPIEMFDESRVAINALEMQHTGLSLITTYGFQPDLWNTKPPLMIWLMVLSARLLGPSVWALRVPALLAGIGTLAIVIGFTWRVTRSRLSALLAGLLLAGSTGFFSRHAVATADYDALACCLTTAYCLMLFFVLHRRQPRTAALLGIGVLIGAAVLTKSIAGLIPGAGVLLYLLIIGRWERPFQSWAYLACALVALVLTGGYYGLREAFGPGYLASVAHNELGGRYLQTIGAHRAPVWHYLQLLAVRRSTFSVGALVFLAPLALLWSRARARLALLYVLCLQLGIVTVFSLGATKLDWYLTPAYPFMAIGMAVALQQALAHPRARAIAARLGAPRWLGGLSGAAGALRVQSSGLIACISLLLLLTGERLLHTDQYFRERPQMLRFGMDYGSLFSALHRQGVQRFTVVDAGVFNTEGFVHYNPQLQFYQLLWSDRGVAVQRTEYQVRAPLGPDGAIVATCDERFIPALLQLGSSLEYTPPLRCAIVRLAQRQLASAP